MKLLFLDIETTGFSRQWDFIIEIAAILIDSETREQLDIYHEYIKPKKPIPIQITEITGITNAQVQNCRSEDDVLETFIQKINNWNPDKLVGHNIDAFDNDFLKKRSEYYFKEFPNIPTIDTLKVAKQKKVPTTMKTATGNPSYKQESIAAGYGIKYDAHSAIEDIKALVKIYNLMEVNAEPDKTAIKEVITKKRNLLGF